jgi:branched-chain amino acid transport system ATP-binding protein
VEILGLEALEIYYDKIKVIDGVTLSMHEGDIVTMLGSNGAGKSTLLKVISGILFCDFGQISFYGTRIENMDPNRIVKLGITQVPEGRRVFPDLSVKENLWMGGFIIKGCKISFRRGTTDACHWKGTHVRTQTASLRRTLHGAISYTDQ